LPPILTGVALWLFLHDSTLVSYGFLLAFLWLGSCPYFLWTGENITNNFLKNLTQKALKKEELDEFTKWVDRTAHRTAGYLLGLPFAIGADYVNFFVFPNIQPLTRIFLMIYISLLFVLAGIGFWGVLSLIRMALRLKNIQVQTNPFDPDGFGGLEFVGSLCIKVTLLFSTGSLVIPLVFGAIQQTDYANAAAIIYSLTALYVVMIFASFLAPTLALHDFFVRIRHDHLYPISEQMNKVLAECVYSENQGEKKKFFDLVSIYKEIDRMKVWPFDLPVVLKLLGSVSLPIIISLGQLALQRIPSFFP